MDSVRLPSHYKLVHFLKDFLKFLNPHLYYSLSMLLEVIVLTNLNLQHIYILSNLSTVIFNKNLIVLARLLAILFWKIRSLKHPTFFIS